VFYKPELDKNQVCISKSTPPAQQPLLGQDLLIIEGSPSGSDTPNSVGLLWKSDQLDAETST